MLEIQGYRVIEQIYQSKRYFIHRAVRNSDQESVILKLCSNEQPTINDLAALQHEFQLLQFLNAPAIIKSFELIKHQHQLGLVIEDFGGQSLHDFLKGESISLDTFFKIALQLADAVGAMHMQQVIHKDLNPNNILVHPKTLIIKLIDFGISTQLNRESQDYIPLKELEGTLAYLSPEQTGRMNRALDYRTDFYSLGITFYQMLTGQLPYQTDDPLELVHSHLAKQPPLITEIKSDIPPMIENIINKLLAKIPEERYTSAAGLKLDLSECQKQWQTQQSIVPFTLGMQDVYDHLIISQKLYGRDEEIAQLLMAFDRVTQGKSELFLVSGYSGIGKTSLVKEIYKPITRQKGYFISGKYDQLKRTMPYSAFIEAFDDLVKRLLAEPQHNLLQLRDNLQIALGVNGQVIIDVLPNIVHIIGEQPAVPELFPGEAQNRFMLTFQNFVRVLAKAEHPLVLFLDDLQWADSASLYLFKLLLTDPELRYFLIIGAYRDNEITPDHPFTQTIQQLQKNFVVQNSISLLPLTENNIQHLLADSLTCPLEKCTSLASLLLEKTQGNPFFINEFLKKFYQDKFLIFSYEKRLWQWDIVQIKQHSMADNVIDLLTTRIQELPDKTQKILMLAACISHTFDLQTLATISQLSLTETAAHLWQAVQVNLVVPIGNQYRLYGNETTDNIFLTTDEKVFYKFVHDRIQQTAYQFIEVSERHKTHLHIGRLLLNEHVLEEDNEHLFDILNHLNQGAQLISDADEKHRLAQANLWAGKKAKQATAYQASIEYLEIGISLLKEDSWQSDYTLTFTLHKELAECEYLTTQFEKANEHFQYLLNYVNDEGHKTEIYQLNIFMLTVQNKLKEALDLGLYVLKTFGIELPKKTKTYHILKAVIAIKWTIGRRQIKDINITPLSNPKLNHIYAIARTLYGITYVIDQPLFALLSCKCLNLSLKYGYHSETSYLLLNYSFILIHALNRYEEGFEFVELANRLKQSSNIFTDQSRDHLLLGSFILLWKHPLTISQAHLKQCYQECVEIGDLTYANYAQLLYTNYNFISGIPLPDLNFDLESVLSFKDRAKVTEFDDAIKTLKNITSYLQGDIDFELPDIDTLSRYIEERENNAEKAILACCYLQISFLEGKYKIAKELTNKYLKYEEFTKATFIQLGSVFYGALAFAAYYHEAEAHEQRVCAKKLNALYKQLDKFSIWSPQTFLQYKLLVCAEILRVENKPLQAMAFYDDAIKAATKNENFRLIGVIGECAARFYISLKREITAKAYLQQAHYGYSRWGANKKAAQLIEQHPTRLQTAANNETHLSTNATIATGTQRGMQSLDSLSLLKSTRAISGEIELKNLLKKLLSILMENSGTQRCLLLSKENNTWVIEAEGTLDAKKIYLNQSETLLNRTDVPLAMINFTERTLSKVLINSDEEREKKFPGDPYCEAVKPKSALLLPILYQSKLRSIFYLENRSTSHVFTEEHINTLELLASQAAISLENARLYHRATHDPLTDLANRSLLHQNFNAAINNDKLKESIIAILFLDLDGFKKINDTLGHEIGDKLLIQFSLHIKKFLREGDLAVRLGGDEFVLMLENLDDIKQVEIITARLLQGLETPVPIMQHEIHINTSIGISLYPKHGDDIETLLKHADMALYQVKSKGKGSYQVFD